MTLRTYTTGELVAYFAATRPHHSRGRQLAAVLDSRHCTPRVTTEILELCEDAAARGEEHRLVWAAAAVSPHTDPALLEEWARDPEHVLGPGAAGNPRLDVDSVAQLWAETRCRRLLTNPNLDPAALRANLDQEPGLIAANPGAPPELLRELAHELGVAVLLNPACPRDLLDTVFAAAGNNAVWAAQNPQLTPADLEALSAHNLDRNSTLGYHVKSANAIVADRLQLAAAEANPLAAPTGLLARLDVAEELAEVVLVGDAHSDATRALLRAGFSGTIGELLECAAATTR